MKHQLATATDKGLHRELNEDCVLAKQRDQALGIPLTLLVVADGMGGHQSGEVASQIAVETVESQLRWCMERHEMEDTQPMLSTTIVSPMMHLEKRLRLAVQAANNEIATYAANHPADSGNMGTTISCALVKGKDAVIANVGDSRTYHLHNGQLQQITNDHSYVGHLVRIGELEPHQLYDHPKRSVITRALDGNTPINIDMFSVSLEPTDQLLLCSDGLWEMVRDDQEIIAALQLSSAEQSVQALITLANRHGGEDNIAVAVVRV